MNATNALVQSEGPGARIGELVSAVVRSVRKRPLAAVATAVGIGFVVGGALSSRTGRVALATAVRHVVRELLKQIL